MPFVLDSVMLSEGIWPVITLSSVDFPHPFAPVRAQRLLPSSVNETSFRISRSAKARFKSLTWKVTIACLNLTVRKIRLKCFLFL